MAGAATLKLRFRSSVAVLGTDRSPRSAERRPARPQRERRRYADMLDAGNAGYS